MAAGEARVSERREVDHGYAEPALRGAFDEPAIRRDEGGVFVLGKREIDTVVHRVVPQAVPLGCREGLERPAVANLGNVHVVAKGQLRILVSAVQRGGD